MTLPSGLFDPVSGVLYRESVKSAVSFFAPSRGFGHSKAFFGDSPRRLPRRSFFEARGGSRTEPDGTNGTKETNGANETA
jgi:hypothetical protein